jgi:hypothetical protein
MHETPKVLLDDAAKELLKTFVHNLVPVAPIGRPRSFDHGAWREFVEYVFQRAEPKDARELVATHRPVRALLAQYGLSDEATDYWAFGYESYMRGWARLADYGL